MEVFIVLLAVFFIAIIYVSVNMSSRAIEDAENKKRTILENQIKEAITKLTAKYAFSVFNLVEEIRALDDTYFLISDNSHCIMSTQNQDLQNEIVKDGFETNFYVHYSLQNTINTILDFYIKNLREMIVNEEKWNDSESLDLIVYRILRNNIVAYYHDWYKSNVGYETLEDFYNANYTTKDFKLLCKIFTYYYIQKTDISMPIVSTYTMLSSKMYDYGKSKMDLELKKRLFDSNSKVNYTTGVNTIELIDRMSGREFEEFIADLFEKRGYKSILTPSSGDYGIDVIAENEFVKIGIQTKCYADKVSNSAVQEAVTGIKHYNLNRAMVITNSYFQPSAIQLAKDNDVILWDRNKLISEIS